MMPGVYRVQHREALSVLQNTLAMRHTPRGQAEARLQYADETGRPNCDVTETGVLGTPRAAIKMPTKSNLQCRPPATAVST